MGALHFAEPDWDSFPGLGLCYEVGRRGGAAPTVLNAANEVAVQAFLEGAIGFLDIHDINRETVHSFEADGAGSESSDRELEGILRIDALARRRAQAGVDARAASR